MTRYKKSEGIQAGGASKGTGRLVGSDSLRLYRLSEVAEGMEGISEAVLTGALFRKGVHADAYYHCGGGRVMPLLADCEAVRVTMGAYISAHRKGVAERAARAAERAAARDAGTPLPRSNAAAPIDASVTVRRNKREENIEKIMLMPFWGKREIRAYFRVGTDKVPGILAMDGFPPPLPFTAAGQAVTWKRADVIAWAEKATEPDPVMASETTLFEHEPGENGEPESEPAAPTLQRLRQER